ncbi:hypothetical protein [Chryseobacterium sp. 3008163]|uniref:hypothetical protein n=1 Tax=Chryseobacterium sp. 3008163 TaxID=2478663 RepID=UPI000F0C032A|nr:hypothetical protein [Chryseobacterium sp. 3008163]AYN00102.1 hypothetical protein EAG08_06970 [Chryseobacterium sp. 3008163]
MTTFDQNENLKKISELLKPEIFKSNLMLISVFIAYFENTCDYIIDQPKTFFSDHYDSEKGFVPTSEYKTNVLDLDPKNPINASLLWFKNLNGISADDILQFGILRRYRNKLTHELPKILLDEGLDQNDFSQKLSGLFSLRIKIERYWFFNFELDFMDIEKASELTDNNITTGGEMIYRLFMDLLSEDQEKANFYSEEIKKKLQENKTQEQS